MLVLIGGDWCAISLQTLSECWHGKSYKSNSKKAGESHEEPP
jgi:hypothetical protein